jgi:hypothetical protein
MNILYVLHKDPGASLGGVERHTSDLARMLSLNKLNIYMLFPCSSEMVVTSFTKGKTVNRRAGGLFCDDLAIEHRKTEDNFASLLEKYSIDTVHFQHLLGLSQSTTIFSGAQAISSSAPLVKKAFSSAFFKTNTKRVQSAFSCSTKGKLTLDR